ncbi:MAG: SPW repeat protein [Acidobacteriaceae bacterium]|nr:SPW repeat protein [Acidobacteriaceae bacterium]MBV9503154.1 SPW repeat protein [Acidobacteriaceae bacterium]
MATYMHPTIKETPTRRDTLIAAQTVSLMCAVGALWLFVSPWADGFSDYRDPWNAWIVGAVMFVCSLIRLIGPARTTFFSYVNAVLAVWILVSPWVYGYAGNGPRLTNSLAVGVFILAMSLVSARETRHLSGL